MLRGLEVFMCCVCCVTMCTWTLLTHVTLTQIILSVFYILTYIVGHTFKTIFYNCTLTLLFL